MEAALLMARRGEGGFTMIELLVSLTVALVGLAGLMSIFVSSAQGNRYAGQAREATEAASAAMEELRAMSIAAIESHPSYEPIDAAGWGPVLFHDGPVAGLGELVYRRWVSARELATDSGSLVLIEVTVDWNEEGGEAGQDNGRDRELSIGLMRTREDRL